MVLMDKEKAELELKGKSPREIYDIVRAQVEKAPGEAAMKAARPLSQNTHKVEIFKVVIARTILAAAEVKP